jgi:hypothetical protein
MCHLQRSALVDGPRHFRRVLHFRAPSAREMGILAFGDLALDDLAVEVDVPTIAAKSAARMGHRLHSGARQMNILGIQRKHQR